MATIPPTVLIVLDGFGANPSPTGNAILNTPTPQLDYLWQHYPHTLLKAAEEEVGLSFGEMGNSEVGHLTIGTGRVLFQSLPRINLAIEDGSFFENPAFISATNHVKHHNSSLHILGMVSVAGVHAHVDHMVALLDLARRQGIKKVYLHPILDGRDSGPHDGAIYIKRLQEGIKRYQTGTIATVMGRAFAMDRNNNWERTEAAYNALFAHPSVAKGYDVQEVIQAAYKQNLDDENVIPTVIVGKDNQPLGPIQSGDAVIFTNYREDRARQLASALSRSEFNLFPRAAMPQNFLVVTMTEYEKDLPVQVAFAPYLPSNTLSDWLEAQGLRQAHISETEKYAHVTYFFNGGRENSLPNEQFIQVASPKPETFVSNPEMAAIGVRDKVLETLHNQAADFIVANFANCDMIGHTGDYEATRKAVSIIDGCVGEIWKAIQTHNGWLFLTADHGNAELKIDPSSRRAMKDHTTSPVPFIAAKADRPLVQPVADRVTLGSPVTGLLTDVAPTILQLLGLPIPEEMTGAPLFV
jgi:2,3-bisphosphoglycerate-independent phosphoglycerate mutase